MDERRIGDLLVDAGVVTRAALEDVLAKKPTVGERRVLSELYELGFANERKLAELLAQRVGAPVAVLSECVVDLDVVRSVPADFLRDHRALPISADERTITVVAVEPDDTTVNEQLAFSSGRRVLPLIGIETILEHTLEAVVDAAARGERVWRGTSAPAGSDRPQVAIARHAPPVALAEANELARQILDALTEGEHASVVTQPVGAVRLKRLVIDPNGAPVVEERVRHVIDPALRTLTIDDVPESAPDAEPVVLVVDDDDAVRTLLTKALEHDGLTVIGARDGDEAVTQMRLLRPHVVLLDAMLPKVHGFEICAALKRSTLKNIPVVMISAIYRGVELAREIQEVHGADYFIEKPFELTYVRKLVGELLRRPHAPQPKPEMLARLIDDAREAYEVHAAHSELDLADADLHLWTSLDPFDGRAWLERGSLCAARSDLIGAMAAYEAAVVYDPRLLLAHLGLAVVYEQLGFRKRARATWQKAKELAPDDATRAAIDRHLA